jgi:two-component system response regulator RegA
VVSVQPRSVKSVLIVDDDLALARAWARVLRAQRRHVLVAESDDSARELAISERPDVALVDLVLDWGRGTSGVSVVAYVRERCPATTIVLVSACPWHTPVLDAGKAGADLVAMKPFRCEDVIRHIETGEPMSRRDGTYTLAKAVHEHIMRVLDDNGGNVTRAARVLGIQRQSLQRRLRKATPRV